MTFLFNLFKYCVIVYYASYVQVNYTCGAGGQRLFVHVNDSLVQVNDLFVQANDTVSLCDPGE